LAVFRGNPIPRLDGRVPVFSSMAFTIKKFDPSQNEALAELEKKTGPSNFFRTMAHLPDAMRDFARLYNDVMGPGPLDRRLKEMVYLAVSTVNECGYCVSHHLTTARQAGLSDREIEDIQAETDQTFAPQERAALRYAREMTRSSAPENDTRDAIWNVFTTEQIVELAMVVALANFTNRFNNGLSVPVDLSVPAEGIEKHRTAA
jgi:uncharacterized peroxidase-related enzyme